MEGIHWMILLVALMVLNGFSFLMMGYDKQCARKNRWRVKERTLFIAAGCFGALGGVLGMHVFRHKTQHWYFRVFFPMMLAAQAALLAAGVYFVYNYK